MTSTSNAAFLLAALTGVVSAPSIAQHSSGTADEYAPPTDKQAAQAQPIESAAAAEDAEAGSDKAKTGVSGKSARAKSDALLAAQAAGYKLVNQDGKEVYCKKIIATGSRLSTRTRCLTPAQMEQERAESRDMLYDLSRRSVNRPDAAQ